jgi:ribulose-5-phosphate 4-epimerase/fuculose-1-phosphate aldolase
VSRGASPARPDLHAVFHTHGTTNVGVAAQKHGLLLMNAH